MTDTRYTERVCNDIREHVITDNEQIFMPQIERMRKVGGKWNLVLRPMFSGYLFITSNEPKQLYERIHHALGKTIFKYVKLIRNDEYIIPLSPSDERIVTEMSDEKHVLRASLGYIKGDKLIVTDGPLQGHEGSVVKIDRHKRTAVIEAEFLGEMRHITVGLEVVKKIN